MSIVAFKKKSVIQYGTHVSGRNPGGIWISRGPHGKQQVAFENNNGFSINGAHRNKGAVGTPMAFSKTKTLFRGRYAVGWGGCCGSYYDRPLFVVNKAVVVPGTQYKYIKPSVINTKGMIETKYKWLNGTFPNYWVKNVYPDGPLKDNVSQGLYIYEKTSANMCTAKPTLDNQGTITESQYALRLTHRCADPLPYQKHIPTPSEVGRCVTIV